MFTYHMNCCSNKTMHHFLLGLQMDLHCNTKDKRAHSYKDIFILFFYTFKCNAEQKDWG